MKRLSAAMLLLLLSVMFTIGGSMAYDHAVYGEDSAYTSGTIEKNKVMSAGTFDVSLTTTDNQSATTSSETNPIFFNSQYWEPGYADAGIINVNSDVPIKFEISVDCSCTELSDLGDVIDVYYTVGNVLYMTSKVEFESSLKKVGSLNDVIKNNLVATGSLPANANYEQPISLVFKMRESAGNYYQGMTLCGHEPTPCNAGFTVTATITQTN